MGADFWIGFAMGILSAVTLAGVAGQLLTGHRSRRLDYNQDEALRRAAWRHARRQ